MLALKIKVLISNLHFTLCRYIERRFSSKGVRIFTVIVFLVRTLVFMGVALYGPAVALNLVTPLSITTSVLLCGGICTVYTGEDLID